MTREEVAAIVANMSDPQRKLLKALMAIEEAKREKVMPLLLEWKLAKNADRPSIENKVAEIMDA